MPFNPQARKIYQSLSNILRDISQNSEYVKGFNLPRGSIVTFHYALWKHDPYPTLIVTDAVPPQYGKDGMLRGININYITFNMFRQKILNNCGNPSFSYRTSIIGDMYLRRAFRRYKWNANNVRLLQMFDVKEIIEKAGIVRAYDPSQAQTIKESIKRQLALPFGQQSATEMAQPQQQQQFVSKPIPGQGTVPGIPTGQQ
jgi:hypothetical protein